MKTYIIIGISTLIILAVLYNWNEKRNLKKNDITENQISYLNVKNQQQKKRNLKLVVSYDFGENLKTISKKATPEIIKTLMKSINWNEFHIVQLEDKNENALHVSGSLADDGLASGFVTEDNHILKTKPISSVNEMTEILLDFLKGEEYWRKKHKYE
jgi:hypothetical protein